MLAAEHPEDGHGLGDLGGPVNVEGEVGKVKAECELCILEPLVLSVDVKRPVLIVGPSMF